MRMLDVVYFSNTSNNTHRFVFKLDVDKAHRIPFAANTPSIIVEDPFILIVPTYGDGAVPKQVVKFLNVEHNRDLMQGVVASGSTNFGTGYAKAGDVISAKCGVPFLYRFELLGTPLDVEQVRYYIEPRQNINNNNKRMIDA